MTFNKEIISRFVFCSLFLLFFSCSNDENPQDDARNNKNEIVLGNVKDILTKAYLDRVENRESESEFILVLLSDEGTVSFKQDGHIDFIDSDKGSAIWAELNSLNASNVTLGEYFYKSNATEPFTFDYSDGAVKIDEGGKIFTVRNGKITVKENSGTYEFEFDLETNSGDNVKGHYKGAVTKIDF